MPAGVLANKVPGFYMPLFLNVKDTSDGTTDFDCPSFQFRWKNQTHFINS